MKQGYLHNIVKLSVFLGILSLGLSACTGPEKETPPPVHEVVFYNWKDFTDLSILKDFEKETGIRVILKEYDTRDMCIAQLQTNPELCDVLILDTYNFPYLKNQKLIREFDPDKIPNWRQVDDDVRQRLAREGIFQPPYVTGTNGVMINTRHVPPDTNSWTVFGDKRYKDRIVLLDDLREALVPILCMSGLSINENRPEKMAMVEKNAELLKKNGVAFGETFANIDQMLNGEKWIAQTYNGDFVYKTKGRKEFKFIFPKEGFLKWIVIFALTSDARNPEAAHMLVNFMLRPDIAARSAMTYSYQAPVKGVDKFMPAEMAENPIINPPPDVLKRAELGRELGPSTNRFQMMFNMMKK
jgi:spermidine/putrescine transport system substrate-binding protein